MGILIAIIGGLLGVAGFFVYQSAVRIISQGDVLFGLGWLFTSIDRADAQAYQMGGLAAMVIGGILLIAGLINLAKSKRKD